MSFCADYRRTAWRPGRFGRHGDGEEHRTLASNAFNAYFDILVSGLLLLSVAVACFLHYPPSPQWISVCVASASYYAVVTVVCFKNLVS